GELGGIERAARRAEDAGFESVWVAETARTAFIAAALVARATERVTVGTAVALAFPRSPTITAMNARDLAELSGGRFILGLGPPGERGARAAGRHPKEISVTTNLITQVAKDSNEAKQLAAVQLAFYATTRSYAPVLAMHGFDHLVQPIREAHARGDFAEMQK